MVKVELGRFVLNKNVVRFVNGNFAFDGKNMNYFWPIKIKAQKEKKTIIKIITTTTTTMQINVLCSSVAYLFE